MHPTQKVTILIPCYNEEEGISEVISRFQYKRMLAHGYTAEILVIDNNSTDQTAVVAAALGARVIHEPKKGKGNAIRAGFAAISPDTNFVVMLDGDATYSPEEILRMLEPLQSEFADVVIGSRLTGKITPGSMKLFNRAGNWGYSFLVRVAHQVNVTDVLTGYFAWKKDVVDCLAPHLTSQGFAIEMEMITKMAKLGNEIYSVPITYHSRVGESNLNPISDGAKILWMFIKSLNWEPRQGKQENVCPPEEKSVSVISHA